MDPIESFIRSNRKFSFHALLNAQSRLSVLQLTKGGMQLEDVRQALAMSGGPELASSPTDLAAHAALVCESVLVLKSTPVSPTSTASSTSASTVASAAAAASGSGSAAGSLVTSSLTSSSSSLQMNSDAIANDVSYITSILRCLYAKCGNNGPIPPMIEEFRLEALMFLSGNKTSPQSQQYGNSPPPLQEIQDDFRYGQQQPSYSARPAHQYGQLSDNQNEPQANLFRFSQSNFSDPHPEAASFRPQNLQRFLHHQDQSKKPFRNSDFPQSQQSTNRDRVELEKSEPIIRLLAQVRKVGMDILFPQSCHDKILACIYVAIRSAATPAHRELIDMVMSVKESNQVSQLEQVSKTKVRGVLALLKHGELLVTQGSENEPVRLYLAPGINSFQDLRERHDTFLLSYMSEYHLFIPAVLRSELVWQVADDMRVQRMDAMNHLVVQLEQFFMAYQESVNSTAAFPSAFPMSVNNKKSPANLPTLEDNERNPLEFVQDDVGPISKPSDVLSFVAPSNEPLSANLTSGGDWLGGKVLPAGISQVTKRRNGQPNYSQGIGHSGKSMDNSGRGYGQFHQSQGFSNRPNHQSNLSAQAPSFRPTYQGEQRNVVPHPSYKKFPSGLRPNDNIGNNNEVNQPLGANGPRPAYLTKSTVQQDRWLQQPSTTQYYRGAPKVNNGGFGDNHAKSSFFVNDFGNEAFKSDQGHQYFPNNGFESPEGAYPNSSHATNSFGMAALNTAFGGTQPFRNVMSTGSQGFAPELRKFENYRDRDPTFNSDISLVISSPAEGRGNLLDGQYGAHLVSNIASNEYSNEHR